MTHYFGDLSLRILFLRLIGSQVYLFNRDTAVPVFIRILRRIPLINKLISLAREPDIHVGDYKGLYYRINKEALECADFVHNRLKLENNKFVKEYNGKFKTTKFTPFVLKWTSIYVFEILNCLYRVNLDKPSQKVLYLRDNPLNRSIYEWWSQKTGGEIQISWLKDSELMAGLAVLTYISVLFIHNLFSRRLCQPLTPNKFRIMKEAVWGFKNPVFRDDFFIDNDKLLKEDLLLYGRGSRLEPRVSACRDAQNSEYEYVDINKVRIPINLLFKRLW